MKITNTLQRNLFGVQRDNDFCMSLVYMTQVSSDDDDDFTNHFFLRFPNGVWMFRAAHLW